MRQGMRPRSTGRPLSSPHCPEEGEVLTRAATRPMHQAKHSCVTSFPLTHSAEVDVTGSIYPTKKPRPCEIWGLFFLF